MVKKKKIIKRVAALGAVALLLLVAIAPVISPAADALPALPGVDSSGNSVPGSVAYLPIPLDRFSQDTWHVSLENPFYSVAVGDSADSFEGYSSSIDVKLYNYGSDPVWEFWNLGLTYDDVGAYTARFGFNHICAGNSLRFSMSNSSQFIAWPERLNSFLAGCQFVLPQYYEYKSTVYISGKYPSLNGNGNWDLIPFSGTYEITANNVSVGSSMVGLPQIQFDALASDFNGKSMIIVDSITISFDLFVSLANVANGAVCCDGFFQLYMPVVMDTVNFVTCDFEDFWLLYPSDNLNTTPGSSNFNLTAFLRDAVGGFFSTEIIPNLSFGVLLAVAISVSLVGILVKRLG